MKKRFIIGLFLLLIVNILLVGCSEKNKNPVSEIKEVKKEINLKNKGLKVIISPTNGSNVNGVIKVKLEKIPNKGTKILVSMVPQGFKGDLYKDKNVIIQWINNPKDGEEILLDTTKLENGIYGIGIAVTYEGAPEASPWIALVQTQVNVKN